MRIPGNRPFVYFRFVEKPGAGQVLLDAGISKQACTHFASVSRRVASLAKQKFPQFTKLAGISGHLMPPSGTSALITFDSVTATIWTAIDEKELTKICHQAQAWMYEEQPK